MIKSAKQVVTPLAGFPYAPQHTVQRYAQQHQRVRSEHQASFHDLRHHFRGACLFEPVQISIIHSAHQHRQIGTRFLNMP